MAVCRKQYLSSIFLSSLLLLLAVLVVICSAQQEERRLRTNNKDQQHLRQRRREGQRNNKDRDLWYQPRIVGGTPAASQAFPFFVELGGLGCGGTLVHSDLVLTAGHCVTGSRNQKLLQTRPTVHVGGTTSGQGIARNIVDVRVHPLYHSETGAYDVALLLLEWPVSHVQPVSIPTDDTYFDGGDSLMTVIGYGYMQQGQGPGSDTLLEADVPYVEDCVQEYPVFRNRLQKSSMLCAGGNGKDACTGDSGGPLLLVSDNHNQQQPLLVGVTSWGIGCQGTRPGVYARVSAASGWIQRQMCEFSYRPSVECLCHRESQECGSIQIDVRLDTYPQETGYTVVRQEDGLVVLDVPAKSIESIYSEPISYSMAVPPGSYEMTITDTYRDGICCQFGSGSIMIDNGETKITNVGRFSDKLVIPFEVNSASSTARDVVHSPTTANPTIMTKVPTPSPTDALTFSLRLEVFHDNYPEETSFVFTNGDSNGGAILYDSPMGTVLTPMHLVTAELHELSAGQYTLAVYDRFQDGLCCVYGSGYVQVVLVEDDGNESVIYYHRGDFKASIEAEIVLPPPLA